MARPVIRGADSITEGLVVFSVKTAASIERGCNKWMRCFHGHLSTRFLNVSRKSAAKQLGSWIMLMEVAQTVEEIYQSCMLESGRWTICKTDDQNRVSHKLVEIILVVNELPRTVFLSLFDRLVDESRDVVEW